MEDRNKLIAEAVKSFIIDMMNSLEKCKAGDSLEITTKIKIPCQLEQ